MYMQPTPVFKRISLIAMLLALVLVVLGAFVRLSDAGLGCPDWPGCYGALTVPQSEAAIAHAEQAYPDKPIEAHKAWKEMAHRYVAGTLGLLILSLFVLGWKQRKFIKVSPWLTSLMLLVVIFQALLGMWTVTMLLRPIVVSSHLLGGMTTLALLTWVAHRHWGMSSEQYAQSKNIKLMARLAIVVIAMQIFLGGWTSSNYAALACTDFPTCQSSWTPSLDYSTAFQLIRDLGKDANGDVLKIEALMAIQWTHRLGALVTFIYMLVLGISLTRIPQMKTWAALLLTVLVLQVSLGIINLLLHLPLVLAVAHNAGAALLLVTIICINSKMTSSKR